MHQAAVMAPEKFPVQFLSGISQKARMHKNGPSGYEELVPTAADLVRKGTTAALLLRI